MSASKTTTGHGHPATHLQFHDKASAPPNRGPYEWTARIVCDEHEFSDSYSVLLFLDHLPDNPRRWELSPNYIGSHCTYTAGALRGHENRRYRVSLTEGFVHLNHGIVRHPELRSLEPDVVVPYLTENLHWCVAMADDEPAKLNSLEVTVYATPLSYPPGAVFPVSGEARRYDGITYGRDGGSRHAPS